MSLLQFGFGLVEALRLEMLRPKLATCPLVCPPPPTVGSLVTIQLNPGHVPAQWRRLLRDTKALGLGVRGVTSPESHVHVGLADGARGAPPGQSVRTAQDFKKGAGGKSIASESRARHQQRLGHGVGSLRHSVSYVIPQSGSAGGCRGALPTSSVPAIGERLWERRAVFLFYLYKSREYGGWGGIRTHGGRKPTAVFKTAALNHSATHPDRSISIPSRRPENEGEFADYGARGLTKSFSQAARRGPYSHGHRAADRGSTRAVNAAPLE